MQKFYFLTISLKGINSSIKIPLILTSQKEIKIVPLKEILNLLKEVIKSKKKEFYPFINRHKGMNFSINKVWVEEIILQEITTWTIVPKKFIGKVDDIMIHIT